MVYFDYGIKWLIAFYLIFIPLEASMFHRKEGWKEENIPPFDELILTWNGTRPIVGSYRFYVRLKTEEWSPFLLYASWGAGGQSSFAEGSSVRVYQDVVSVKTGPKATAFEVKVEGTGGASLEGLRSLHVYVNEDVFAKNETSPLESIHLDVPGLSQRILSHPRSADLCSPTSTAAVVRYLSKKESVDPVQFAERSWDGGFDIFGNWVLNVAHASSILGSSWNCWVERLHGFVDLHARLRQNTPVVVSVRGPLSGSALPYAKGHLLVVTGFDATSQRVLCMDPAFPTNEETITSYPIQDFIDAWSRRGFISYIFEQ